MKQQHWLNTIIKVLLTLSERMMTIVDCQAHGSRRQSLHITQDASRNVVRVKERRNPCRDKKTKQ